MQKQKSLFRWSGWPAMLCITLLVSVLSAPALATGPSEEAATASRLAAQTDAEPSLGAFLDAAGHLQLPPGFSGSVNPAGYRIVSGEGEALRFAPEEAKGVPGDGWIGIGGIGNGCNGIVRAFAIGGAGEIYVGGDFTLCADVPANRVARFDTVTQSWASLAGGVNGSVQALAVSGSKVYAGGSFNQANFLNSNNIAMFDTTTQNWANLGSGAANGVSGGVSAIAISGSDVYVGGFFSEAGGVLANKVARFNTTTQAWAPIGSGLAGVDDVVDHLAVAGSTVYVGGRFSVAGGVAANNVARFDTTTQNWASLGSGAGNGVSGRVFALAVSGNTIYAGGFFTQAGGAPANRVARFSTSTQTWASLGSGASNGVDSQVFRLAVSGSTVYVGGNITQAGGAPANRVARFDTSAQTWSTLGSGAANGVSGTVLALTVFGDSVYVGGGGGFNQAGDVIVNNAARFNMTTQNWAGIGSNAANGVSGTVFALTVSGDSVYVGGEFTQAGGALTNRVARLDTNSQTWTSLGSGPANGVSGTVFALAVSGNMVYVGGNFTQAGGALANRVARFDINSQNWASLGSATNGVSGTVLAIAVSGDSVYVGGGFNQAGGALTNNVARFDTTTQNWTSLGNGGSNGVNGTVFALAVSGNTLYVGGDFTQAGGAVANRVARFDTATQNWTSLGNGSANGASDRVRAFAVSGNTVYVGGDFTQAGGAVANRVARFDTSTQTWASLGSGATNGVNERVQALAVSGNRLYVGGEFTLAGSAGGRRVAAFDMSTQSWTSLGSGPTNGVNESVSALATVSGAIYVGGNFTIAGGQVSSSIARYRIEGIFRNGFE